MDLPCHGPLANPDLSPPGAGFIPPLTGGDAVEQLRAELALAQQALASREAALHAAQLKIQRLTLELANHNRLRFGQKSEVLAQNQGDLFAETVLIDQAAIEAEIDRLALQLQPTRARTSRVRAGRQPLPDHLPRIEHRHEPESCQCGQCGQDLVKIGEDVTEQLDVEPAATLKRPSSCAEFAAAASSASLKVSVTVRPSVETEADWRVGGVVSAGGAADAARSPTGS